LDLSYSRRNRHGFAISAEVGIYLNRPVRRNAGFLIPDAEFLLALS
jgi:hypothetical protein